MVSDRLIFGREAIVSHICDVTGYNRLDMHVFQFYGRTEVPATGVMGI